MFFHPIPAAAGSDGAAPLQPGACKLLVEDARIGRIIGKAGSGLQALRSSSGARLRIEKMLFWGHVEPAELS